LQKKNQMKGTHFKEPAIGGSIKRQIVNPDLEEERAKCTFNQEEILDIIYVPGYLQYYKPMIDDMRNHPSFSNLPLSFSK